jgi:hypothetical protein
MTLKAQNAALFGGNAVLQSGTGTTAGLIQFLIGNSTAAFFDANQAFRIGPSAAATVAGPNGTSPLAGTDYIFANSAAGSILSEFFTESSSQRAGYFAYNAATGGTGVSGISIQAPGTTYTVGNYQGQGVIEQSGLSTSAIVLSKVLGDGTSRAITGRIFQSGAWSIGDLSSSSSFNQAGLSGPLFNFAAAGGTLTTTGGQGVIYKTFAGGPDQGTIVIQGHTGINFVSSTTLVANTTTTKFITSVGRRVKLRTTTTTPDTMTTADEVLSIGAIAAPFTVNLPAAPTSGDTYTVKDALGNAGAFNITISGNGSNIDGSATIVISTNYTEAMFVYNGTSWISSLTNNISPNTGYSSVVNVPSGGSANVVGFDQLLLCDPTTTTCTITAPASPILNMRFTVKDATFTANGTHFIAVSGNGKTLEDPNTPGSYVTPVNLQTAGRSATWAFDSTRNRYTLVSTAL